MSEILEAIFQRRAIKEFDAVPIPPQVREQLLDAARVAPASFKASRTGSIGWRRPRSEKTRRGFAWGRPRRKRLRR